jgi:DNA-binding response OmpR family regulator
MPKKILIIETNQSLLSILKDSFKRAGHSVISTRNGQEGVELALTEHPDLILLDATSSDTAGTEVLVNLKNSSAKNILLIFLGNQSRREYEAEVNNINSRIKFIDKNGITMEHLAFLAFSYMETEINSKKIKAGEAAI